MAFDFSQGELVPKSNNPATSNFDFQSGKSRGGFVFAPTSSPTIPVPGSGDPNKPIIDDQLGIGKFIKGTVDEGLHQLGNAGRALGDTMKPDFNSTDKLLSSGARIAGGVTGAVLSPFTTAFSMAQKGIGDQLPPNISKFVGHIIDPNDPKSIPAVLSNIPALQKFAQENPNAEEVIGAFMNILGAAGLPDAAAGAGNAASTLSEKVSPVLDATLEKGKGALETVKSKVLGSPEQKAAGLLSDSVEAVNPDLTGKKLTNAYKQAVTGNREITPSSIFGEQGLSPDQQTANLGKRLNDLGLGKDPVKNLDTLGSALKDTEAKIDTALKGDPELNYNANKPELAQKLDTLKTKLPREFSAIKDSTTAFNDVVDFAKETLAKTEDTITGLRDARSAFDAQARIEYPNAFKEGGIDIKTPAGRAIKLVRDTMNEHLYNTAPNGSEIQQLIGREADIFRATDNIAPKAAAGDGATGVAKFVKEHPWITSFAKGTGLIFSGEEIGRRFLGR